MRSPHRAAIAAIAVAVIGPLLTGCGGTSTAQPGTPTHSSSPATPSSGSTDLLNDPSDDTSAPPSTGSAPASSTSAPAPAPGSASPVSDAVSACSLATEAEVADVLGEDPGAGLPISSHGATQCQFGEYQSAFVLINLLPSQGRTSYDNFRKDPHVGDAGTVADVDGVGDRAFSVAGPMTASIFFNEGDAMVVVLVAIHGAASSPMDQALSLAKLAAGRV
jgi:hypothetical protein